MRWMDVFAVDPYHVNGRIAWFTSLLSKNGMVELMMKKEVSVSAESIPSSEQIHGLHFGDYLNGSIVLS